MNICAFGLRLMLPKRNGFDLHYFSLNIPSKLSRTIKYILHLHKCKLITRKSAEKYHGTIELLFTLSPDIKIFTTCRMMINEAHHSNLLNILPMVIFKFQLNVVL